MTLQSMSISDAPPELLLALKTAELTKMTADRDHWQGKATVQEVEKNTLHLKLLKTAKEHLTALEDLKATQATLQRAERDRDHQMEQVADLEIALFQMRGQLRDMQTELQALKTSIEQNSHAASVFNSINLVWTESNNSS